jgi:hypothetical protein
MTMPTHLSQTARSGRAKIARPFRLTPPEPSEAELQANVVELLDKLLLPPSFAFSAAIGACQLTPQQAAALVRAGVKRGLPDLFIIGPGGRLFGLELKRQRHAYLSKTRVVRTKRGSPRVLIGQVERFAELEATGMEPIAICRSVAEVLSALQQWGIPLRGRVAA